MESLMKKDLVEVINRQRSGTIDEYIAEPNVITEDIEDKVFDIVDGKGTTATIKRNVGEGTATYFNGDEQHVYKLRFIRYEEYLNQFEEWTKGVGRADYIVYDCSGSNAHFIIHELSDGKIGSKLSKARTQLFATLHLLFGAPRIKEFIERFSNKMCILTAGSAPVCSPNGMADGFNQIYEILPDPIPINAKLITNRGFKAFETRNIKL